MQHYGVPTRLLDWTDGALVGLYFALKNRGNQGDQYEGDDAGVYMLDPWWLNERAFKEVRKKKKKRPTGVALPNWREARQYLMKDEFDSDLLKPIIPLAVDPSHLSRRFAAQRSRFTIFGKKKAGLRSLINEPRSRIVKFIVKESAISDMQRSLNTLGISESTVFPDLDGLGRELKLAFDARQPSK